ncbi:MAG: flavodoxin family protein [Brevinematia bacterium]
MKALVLYFSLQGHSKRIANIVKDELGADIEKIELKKPLPKGFLKFLIGGMMTVFNKKPEILPLKNNPEGYDLIIFCSPVWATNVSAPFNTVISSYKIENKKIGILCSYAGMGEISFQKFKSKLSSTNSVVIEKAFNEKEVVSDKIVQELKNILKAIK